MYRRGLRQLHDKEEHLQDLRARDLAQIRKNQEFSLAEGAFARHEDKTTQFKKKLQNVRTGCLSKEKERLYSRSKEQQELGKKRREAIALASLRRKHPPQKDYGVISPDRAANMYRKGLRQLHDKEGHLRDLRAKDLAQIRKNQKFSLARVLLPLVASAKKKERLPPPHLSRRLI